MNLQPIDSTASKQEEIDLLNKVAKLFGNGTYVHDFLSEITLGWVEQKIKNDFPPELFEAYIHEKDECNAVMGKLLKAEAELTRSEKFREEATATYNRREQEMTMEISRLKEERIRYIDSMSASIDEVRAERNDAQAKLMVTQTEVNRLKIEVYDLTHPK